MSLAHFVAAPHESMPIGIWSMLLVYAVGGPAAGVLIGVLLPLGKTWLGAMFVGVLAAAPACFLIIFMLMPHGASTRIGLIAASIMTAYLGGFGGLVTWARRRFQRGG